MTETPLEQAIAFIEGLTVNPLLMADDIEMTLEDVQEHARIELESIKRSIAASPPPLNHVMGSDRPYRIDPALPAWDVVPNAERIIASLPDDQRAIIAKRLMPVASKGDEE